MGTVWSILKRRSLKWMLLMCLALLSSCKKNNNKPDFPTGTNENVNTWILDSLKRYYYWSETLPSKPDFHRKPQDFFTSIRNPADRFSALVLPGDPSSYSPGSKNKYGFDYSTVKELNSGQVIGIIKLVLNESPASRSGLKRGDYIRKINGMLLTEANAETLQAALLSSNQVTLGLTELSGNSWIDTRSVEIGTGAILDQHEISRIIESGGRKIGYLNFDTFNPGLASSLVDVFANFKSTGISDLILDLRYNGGGQVAEAAGLCVLIAGLPYNKPLITYKGNKNGGTRTESVGSAATFDGTVNFSTLLQNNLGLIKVYILATGATASASEVMINNLKPYMQVILVGEKTKGKDEASFRIFDERKPKVVEWEMHPIIYKLFNAAGDGAYSAGINPDINVNELATLPLLPFGEANDPLVKAALLRITGKPMPLSGLKQEKTNVFSISKVLTDTRLRAIENSIVLTHR